MLIFRSRLTGALASDGGTAPPCSIPLGYGPELAGVQGALFRLVKPLTMGDVMYRGSCQLPTYRPRLEHNHTHARLYRVYTLCAKLSFERLRSAYKPRTLPRRLREACVK
jgi:hypothetical protein